jgi:hypothetical protein
MKNHNFILVNCDTDSITFCRANGEPFSKQEQLDLLNELNSLYPEQIKFEHDGYFPSFVVVKSKNYIMKDEKGKIKIKGSSMRSLKTETILKDMIQEVVTALIEHRMNDIQDIYIKYIKLAKYQTDILKWSKKATITKSVLNCKGYTEEDILDKKIRRNETEVWDAVKDIHIQEGDRVQLYPAILSSEVIEKPIIRKNRKTGEMEHKGFKAETVIKYGLKLVHHFNNDVDTEHLVKRVYDTLNIFKTVLDMEQFIKYHNSGNKKLLEEL